MHVSPQELALEDAEFALLARYCCCESWRALPDWSDARELMELLRVLALLPPAVPLLAWPSSALAALLTRLALLRPAPSSG